jgi:hypothetical protein
MKNSLIALPLALLLAAAGTAVPAEAQGNGRGQQQRELREDRRDRDQPRFERRDDDRRQGDQRRGDDRYQTRRNVPPGWCIGRGNPHNTPANCGYRDNRGRNARYDTRYERRGGSYGSYDEAHRQFHREHDAWCAARRRERPLDLRWQAQVRMECREAHDRFHREWGRSH